MFDVHGILAVYMRGADCGVVGFRFAMFVRPLGGKSSGWRGKCRVYAWISNWGVLGGGSTNSDSKRRRARLIVGLLHIWELDPAAPFICPVRIEVVEHRYDLAMSTCEVLGSMYPVCGD